MSNERILIRGTTAQRLSVTPAKGQIGSDDDLKKVVLGDGTTVGGILMARQDETDAALANRVRYDAAQTLTPTQRGQAWANIGGGCENDDLIVNGCFDVAQRGTSQTSAGYGSLDRWSNGASGGTVTQSRESFTLGDTLGSSVKPFFGRQAVTGQSATSHFARRSQVIEDVRSYAGQTITVLGFARRSSGSGNMAIDLSQSFGTGGSPSAAVTGIGAQQVALTTSWAAFACVISVPSITGKVLGSNGDDGISLNLWASAGGDFNARTGNLGIQTVTVDVFGVHIRKGIIPVSAVNFYSPQPMWATEPACNRYYWRSRPFGSLNFNGYAANALMSWPILFPVRMRATPTLSSNFAGVTYGGASSLTWDSGTRDGGRLILNTTSANANANFTLGANDWVAADSEIAA